MPFFAPCSLLFSLVFVVVYFLLDTIYLSDDSLSLFTFFWFFFALSVRLFLDWCLEFRLRPPAGRLEGFLRFNPTPRERGTCYSNRLYWFIPSMEGNSRIYCVSRYLVTVHPLEEGNCLFSSKSFKTNFSKLPLRQWIKIINTKINFSKLPVRQSSNHRAGLEVILYLRIWRARLCVGRVQFLAIVLRCQLSAWSSRYVIKWLSASSSM